MVACSTGTKKRSSERSEADAGQEQECGLNRRDSGGGRVVLDNRERRQGNTERDRENECSRRTVGNRRHKDRRQDRDAVNAHPPARCKHRREICTNLEGQKTFGIWTWWQLATEREQANDHCNREDRNCCKFEARIDILRCCQGSEDRKSRDQSKRKGRSFNTFFGFSRKGLNCPVFEWALCHRTSYRQPRP